MKCALLWVHGPNRVRALPPPNVSRTTESILRTKAKTEDRNDESGRPGGPMTVTFRTLIGLSAILVPCFLSTSFDAGYRPTRVFSFCHRLCTVCYCLEPELLISVPSVDNEVISKIGKGLMVLVGIGTGSVSLPPFCSSFHDVLLAE
jgi:hypothetical protein